MCKAPVLQKAGPVAEFALKEFDLPVVTDPFGSARAGLSKPTLNENTPVSASSLKQFEVTL